MTIKKVGLIGHPIAHSLSPTIHRHWLQVHAIEGLYNVYDIKPEGLSEFIIKARVELTGFNVTVPHKESILKYCDEVSDLARLVGAVNTVKIENGKIYGDNTDVFGFATALLENIKNKNKELHKNKAVILGAGGACRAGIIALKQLGFDNIIIVNRTFKKAIKLANEFGVDAFEMKYLNKALEDATLLVNTSIAGMNGDNIIDMDISKMHEDAIVYDIVYKPLQTDMLMRAKENNLCAIMGIDMLLYQAVSGFERWFGKAPTVDDILRQKVLGK